MMLIVRGFAVALAAAVITFAADAPALVCLGTRPPGAPVVILEAGAGNGVETWAKVRPAIAELARVCTYDRPGLRRHWAGEEAPAAPSPDAVIATLESALTTAGERPPYVMVGHSYGGMIVRLYATRFPDRVTGVVLIDSSHEDQLRRFGDPAPHVPSREPGVVINVPELFDIVAMSEALKARPWHADVPLLVLTRSNPSVLNPPTPPDAAALARYDIWLELQRELATRSPRGEQIVATRASHFVQIDEPRLVIDGIRRIVAAR